VLEEALICGCDCVPAIALAHTLAGGFPQAAAFGFAHRQHGSHLSCEFGFARERQADAAGDLIILPGPEI
jgi:hypothetical protein